MAFPVSIANVPLPSDELFPVFAIEIMLVFTYALLLEIVILNTCPF